MHKLIEYICDELDELERKADKNGNLTMTEVQYMDTLAHAKKNLLKAEEMSEDKEYNMNMGGDSYAYARGDNRSDGRRSNRSYARGRNNARRDSMGRYSREDGYSMDNDEVVEEIRGLMQSAPDEYTRKELEKLTHKLEQM